MRGMILLIIKYGGFLSFVLMEIISLSLVVRYNGTQRNIWINSSNYFVGQLNERMDNITKYWNLSAVSDSLAQENARLRAELRAARFQENILQDSASNQKWQQQYTFIAAEVVSNSTREFNNYLTINRGKRHGIKERMGVISNDGIVGTVIVAGEYYSTVMSLLHKESRIAASIKRTTAFGSLVWEGSRPTKASLKDVPKHTTVVVGDTVQTNGYSARFPAGIQIGFVAEEPSDNPGSNFYNISVNLSTDLSTVKYVYVVNNLMAIEREAVEGQARE